MRRGNDSIAERIAQGSRPCGGHAGRVETFQVNYEGIFIAQVVVYTNVAVCRDSTSDSDINLACPKNCTRLQTTTSGHGVRRLGRLCDGVSMDGSATEATGNTVVDRAGLDGCFLARKLQIS